jgi:SAM-dependent methyltransferase
MTKESVRRFYDEKGWCRAGDTYVDTQLYVDVRPVVQQYMRRADARVQAVLAPEGRLFLDVGCGAKPKMELSTGYQKHVCVDFSITGLREARRKLGARGLYVMADATALPFAEDLFDAVISAHVIYHIPGLENQRRAMQEVYRMVKPGRTGAILYANPYHVRYFDLTWGWKGLARHMFRFLGDMVDRLRGRPHWAADKPGEERVADGELFYKSYPPAWVRRFLPPGTMEIRCLRWLTKTFTSRRVQDTPNWRRFLHTVTWLEDRLPHLLAYGANYLLLVVRKG